MLNTFVKAQCTVHVSDSGRQATISARVCVTSYAHAPRTRTRGSQPSANGGETNVGAKEIVYMDNDDNDDDDDDQVCQVQVVEVEVEGAQVSLWEPECWRHAVSARWRQVHARGSIGQGVFVA